MKRKEAEKATGKRKKEVEAGPVLKKRRKDSQRSNDAAPRARAAAAASANAEKEQAPGISLLQKEEKSFPRGGASILTPLEHRQIQVQATRDVLFEESGQKQPRKEDEDSDDDETREELHSPDAGARIRKNTKKSRNHQPKGSIEEEQKHLSIDGLKFKNLSPGCMVLGCVSRITRTDIILDIPNNLTGVVSLTSISNLVTKKLETVAENSSANELNQDEDEDPEGFDLKRYVHLGQYLRATVLSNREESDSEGGAKSRKKIELSLDPKMTNENVLPPDIAVNAMLQASVKSVEDHGLVMDLGLSDESVKGFIGKEELPQDVEIANIAVGAVFLSIVTGLSSNRKVVKLSANANKAGNLSKAGCLVEAPTINPFLPGTVVEVLVSRVTSTGIAGKIMGLINATVDLVHSGAAAGDKDLESAYKSGSKLKARIIFTQAERQGGAAKVSILDHILSLSADSINASTDSQRNQSRLLISSIVDDAKVVNVEPSLGLFVKAGNANAEAFVHISRVADKRIAELSRDAGAFGIGTTHKARIIGYNAFDRLYLASFEQSVLTQQFLRLEDIPVGEVVKGKVEKIIVKASGLAGIVVSLATGLNGFVPPTHLSDVQSASPEKRFPEGSTVVARVLSTDPESRQIRLTLKKSLVNSSTQIWNDYDTIKEGDESVGTVAKVNASGAVVQFWGNVRAFLPRSEMHEYNVSDPLESFWPGKTVNVRVVSINATDKRMIVSCKPAGTEDETQLLAFRKLKLGQIVSGKLVEKASKGIVVVLDDVGLNGTLHTGQLTDKSSEESEKALTKLRPNQTLHPLTIIGLTEKGQKITLSKKPSLVKAANAGKLVADMDKLTPGQEVDGFVNNVTKDGIFVQFAGGVTALIHKNHIKFEMKLLPGFGVMKDDSISARVLQVDHTRQRLALTMLDDGVDSQKNSKPAKSNSSSRFNVGDVTEARITSVKETQINVHIGDAIQGRIDVSEAFKTLEEIKDRKFPLKAFRAKQVLSVKVLGIHDARNHRFLPISNRGGKNSVLELSAKVGEEQSVQSLEECIVGAWYTGFVNNVSSTGLWVNLAPNIRGRVERMRVSDDVSVLNDLESKFPLGSAIRVQVLNTDILQGRLDLSAITQEKRAPVTIETVSKGTILTGRVTNVTEHAVFVQLSEGLSGQVPMTELADDFELANPTTFEKNDIARVCVIDVDKPNKRLTLSLRPSKVLSSSLPVKDRSIEYLDQLKVGDLVRGFIKAITDQGLFVKISHSITAFVRVSEISDAFVKDWKSEFEIDRLTTGKVISVDPSSNKVQLSLKKSVTSKDYVPLLTFFDIKEGQVVAGKIRKVEDFGAFIVVEHSHNVSGLAHRSEIAEKRVEDVRKYYQEGDLVKALVLKVEPESRRISFGLKASYFQNGSDAASEQESGDEFVAEASEDEGGVEVDPESDDGEADLLHVMNGRNDSDDGDEKPPNSNHMQIDSAANNETEGLDGLEAGGFDWAGHITGEETDNSDQDEGDDGKASKKKKKAKAGIKIDQSGDLDLTGPQSVNDFERLLLGQRNSSSLWVQYMAFHLQMGQTDAARGVAERALKEININEQEEKLNVWVAMLNLENAYGDDETEEEIAKRACEYNDAEKVRESLASIYITSGKHEKADELFQKMMKKKEHSSKIKFWTNYASFLFDSVKQPDRARQLLDRAMQSIAAHARPDLVKEFGQLEFKSKNGEPERGRTIFEGLLDSYPKRWDLWDIFVALETQQGAFDNVRRLFERMALKRHTNKVFKPWLKFEEQHGSGKQINHVKNKQAAYEEQLRAKKLGVQ